MIGRFINPVFLFSTVLIAKNIFAESWTASNQDFVNSQKSDTCITPSGLVSLAVKLESKTLTGALPSVRYGAASVYYPPNNKIYVIGGFQNSSTPLSDILEFVVNNATITKKAETIPARGKASALYFPENDKIFIFSGTTNDSSGSFLNEIYEYYPATGKVEKSSATLPPQIGSIASVYYPPAKKIFLYGMFKEPNKNSYRTSIVEFNPALKTTTILPQMISYGGESDPAAIYDGNNSIIYLIGNGRINEFNPETQKDYLDSRANLFTSESFPVKTEKDYINKIYLLGGMGGMSSAKISTYDTISYSIVDRSETLNTARSYSSCAYSPQDDSAYLFGGTGLASIEKASFIYISTGTMIFEKKNDTPLSLRKIKWVYSKLSGTAIKIQVRTKNEGSSWSFWSGELTDPSGELLETPFSDYVQVKALFSTAVSSNSPVLNSITLEQEPYIVREKQDIKAKLYNNRYSYSEKKPIIINYTLPAASPVTIKVYTLEGELVWTVEAGNTIKEAGNHSASWKVFMDAGEPPAGIYVINIKTDYYEKNLKAAVIR